MKHSKDMKIREIVSTYNNKYYKVPRNKGSRTNAGVTNVEEPKIES